MNPSGWASQLAGEGLKAEVSISAYSLHLILNIILIISWLSGVQWQFLLCVSYVASFRLLVRNVVFGDFSDPRKLPLTCRYDPLPLLLRHLASCLVQLTWPAAVPA